MHPILNEFELRVVGSLIEKQIATPAYYPMTLNALTNACNQKNHRDPVVSYDETTVERAIDGLRAKNLAYVFHGSEARVPKYAQQFSKYFELNQNEVAVLCVLILRGPQTPGELRSRTAHLQNFEHLSEIESTLEGLMSRAQPLIVKMTRQPGARESRYAHLIGGEIIVENQSENITHQKQPERDRIGKLEEEVSLMRQELEQLKRQFQEFKKLFE
jgi:uncharacterized protein YceH (UPF0502 family)